MTKKKEADKSSTAKKDYKKELEIALNAIKEWNIAYDQIVEDKEYWYQIADKAHKEQEEMLHDLNKNLEMMQYHCQQTQLNTGEINLEDVIYSSNMINRIMQAKFNPEIIEE